MTISLVLLLGVAVVVTIRAFDLPVSQALLCIVFGFFLASSGLAPTVRQILDQIIALISNIRI